MKKVIITGVSGFIGSATACYLLEQGIEVVGLSRTKPEISDKNFIHLPMELSKVDEICTDALGGADVFYHFAWEGSAGIERSDTKLQLSNVQWTIDCLKLAKALDCPRFVVAGSIMERETLAAALNQGGRPGLAYVYGGGKLAAHIMCKSIAADLGIGLVWTLITNAYGVGEYSPRFVNSTIRKILREEELQFTSGTQNYDFVYISDVAKAFYLIGKNGRAFNEYVIGSGHPRPLKEFILEMKESLAPDREFVFGNVPFTGTNLPISAFDCSNTTKDTGFVAEISFSKGVKKTMEWIEEKDR